jgi:hypothetical protein
MMGWMTGMGDDENGRRESREQHYTIFGMGGLSKNHDAHSNVECCMD